MTSEDVGVRQSISKIANSMIRSLVSCLARNYNDPLRLLYVVSSFVCWLPFFKKEKAHSSKLTNYIRDRPATGVEYIMHLSTWSSTTLLNSPIEWRHQNERRQRKQRRIRTKSFLKCLPHLSTNKQQSEGKIKNYFIKKMTRRYFRR